MKSLISRILDKVLSWHESYKKENLKSSLGSCGARVWLGHEVIIWSTDNVILEDDVAINSFTHVFGAGGVRIGARTLISACCSISSVTHPEPVAERRIGIELPVVIEEDCWLGTGAIVLPGVRIGKGSIVAAGAVVTKDIPPLSVAMGVPARVVRQIRT
ncbi:sugar O-acetyltransferase [Acidobacteria bacterium AB60]|nr:sugar O-acetyltransferase [Acidobacteria bacterium AB60]